MFVIPFAKRSFLHHVVEDFTGNHAVVAGHPHGAKRPEGHAKPGGGIVNQTACLEGADAFPFGHDASKRTRAVVPRPDLLHRCIVGCDVGIGWHDRSSLVR